MTPLPLLWVEDDAALKRVYRPLLTAGGFQLTEAASAGAAREIVQKTPFDLVLLDLMLPPSGLPQAGLELLRELLAARPAAKVIVLSGAGDRAHALEAVRSGAHDFLSKPIDPDVLLVVLERAASRLQMERTVAELRSELALQRPADAMLGRAPPLLLAMELADRVAPTTLPVLITGENGTGKELLARRIHRHSPRAQGPFVAINCGALPPTLLESTLFGHVRGAFTGSVGARKGVFAEADGGTLFLDEVADLDPATQVRLLRAIENQEILPVGADRPVTVDVRFVSATHQQLETRIADGTFRDDLYWRLKGIEIHLPPLRDRGEDIALLAHKFAADIARSVGMQAPPAFSEAALAAMASHPWPGNLRELRHAVQRGAVMALPGHVIEAVHLGLTASEGPDGSTLAEQVERLERRAIHNALALEGGNRSRAARRLGLSRQGLLNKIARYGLVLPEDPE